MMSKIFVGNPANRISIAGIKSHPWFTKNLPDELKVCQYSPQVIVTSCSCTACSHHVCSNCTPVQTLGLHGSAWPCCPSLFLSTLHICVLWGILGAYLFYWLHTVDVAFCGNALGVLSVWLVLNKVICLCQPSLHKQNLACFAGWWQGSTEIDAAQPSECRCSQKDHGRCSPQGRWPCTSPPQGAIQ